VQQFFIGKFFLQKIQTAHCMRSMQCFLKLGIRIYATKKKKIPLSFSVYSVNN